MIRTERLELPLLSRAQLGALAAGDGRPLAAELDAAVSEAWVEEVRRLAALRATQLAERPQDEPWLLRAIVRSEADAPRAVIGYLNFHAAPDERGWAEIGYALLPEARGRGYAIEAVRAAFDWAAERHGVRRFRASVAPDNERSLNLIRKLGFVEAGAQWDAEDGLELVFELDRWRTDGT